MNSISLHDIKSASKVCCFSLNKRELEEAVPFMTSKRVKILRIKLNDGSDWYTLIGARYSWKKSQFSGEMVYAHGRNSIAVSTTQVRDCTTVDLEQSPVKIPIAVFHRNRTDNVNICLVSQRPPTSWSNLEKEQRGCLLVPWFKLACRDVAIKRWFEHKNRDVDWHQSNIKEARNKPLCTLSISMKKATKRAQRSLHKL